MTQIFAMDSKHRDHINDGDAAREDTIFSIENEEKNAPGCGVEDTREEAENPPTISNGLEQWNKPRINVYRYLATLYCFIIMGMNDAAYGVSLPLLKKNSIT
jgi:hypothetical protein